MSVKRTIVEVLLALGLIGAGVFGWMNWKQVQTVKSQAVELKAASEEAAKLAATSQGAIAAAEEQAVALKAQ